MSDHIIRNAEDILAIFPTLSSEERVTAALRVVDMCLETDPMLGALKQVLSSDEKETLMEWATKNRPVEEVTPPNPVAEANSEAQFAVFVALAVAETGLGHLITTTTTDVPDTFTFSAENEANTLHLDGAVTQGTVCRLVLSVMGETGTITEHPIVPPTKETFLTELAKHRVPK